MNIKKYVYLDNLEIQDAIQEYLSKRNILFSVDGITFITGTEDEYRKNSKANIEIVGE